MDDMLYCHSCKLEPSSIAHFDFQYPLAPQGKPPGELSFSTFMTMFVPSVFLPVLEVHVDIFPVSVLKLLAVN